LGCPLFFILSIFWLMVWVLCVIFKGHVSIHASFLSCVLPSCLWPKYNFLTFENPSFFFAMNPFLHSHRRDYNTPFPSLSFAIRGHRSGRHLLSSVEGNKFFLPKFAMLIFQRQFLGTTVVLSPSFVKFAIVPNL